MLRAQNGSSVTPSSSRMECTIPAALALPRETLQKKRKTGKKESKSSRRGHGLGARGKMDVEIRNGAHGCKGCSRQGALTLKVRGCKWRRGNGPEVGTQKPLRSPMGPDLAASPFCSPRKGRIKEYHKII